jgi:hypothetical protein
MKSITGHIRYLKLLLQNEPLRFYRKVRHQKHVFIFSIVGRSSSTAFQRILNSSAEICIFGETKGSLAGLLEAYAAVEHQWHYKSHWRQTLLMENSYKTGKHTTQYPHALDLHSAYFLLPGLVAGIFRPLIKVKRFGFKEIELFTLDNLRTLKGLFPECRMIFLFRDPLEQYPSLLSTHWYNEDEDSFIETYSGYTDQYLEYTEEDQSAFFLENKHLYDSRSVAHILDKLSISKFDKDLVNDGVFSSGSKPVIHPKIREKILGSSAYDGYKNMAARADSFMREISR